MPASRNASPCSSHHSPTVPNCLADRHGLMGKIAGDFFGRQIDVGKNHDSGGRLFEHLGPPAGIAAAVETFAALEAKLLEDVDQPGEIAAAGAIGMMVVIGPADAQPVLPRSFAPGRPDCGRCQYCAFGGKEQVARPVDAQVVNCSADQLLGLGESMLGMLEMRGPGGGTPRRGGPARAIDACSAAGNQNPASRAARPPTTPPAGDPSILRLSQRGKRLAGDRHVFQIHGPSGSRPPTPPTKATLALDRPSATIVGNIPSRMDPGVVAPPARAQNPAG